MLLAIFKSLIVGHWQDLVSELEEINAEDLATRHFVCTADLEGEAVTQKKPHWVRGVLAIKETWFLWGCSGLFQGVFGLI